MLVLSRRDGQVIMIGDDVTITVLGIKGNQVRLGIVAPKEVSIMRPELLAKGVTRENGVFKGDDNNG